MRHISGQNNVVAVALSRVEEIHQSIDWKALSEVQKADAELQRLKSDSSLVLKIIKTPEVDVALVCDVRTSTARPYVPQQFRRIIFDKLHNPAPLGINTTVRTVSERYVWPSINKDCRIWARSCVECELTRHVSTPPTNFEPATERFAHVHLDIVILPISEGCRYCLTCVDRFTRWPEAIPLENQEATTVAHAFYSHWIARFGTPLKVTTDQGRQFESNLFKELNQLLGVIHYTTTAYHPAANGMVERFHRQLKAAIRCHRNEQWTRTLPTVLLGIRSAWKCDLQCTAAELVYGQQLKLPAEFLADTRSKTQPTSEYVQTLRQEMQKLRPTQPNRHGEKSLFLFKDLATTDYVFVRHDGPKTILQCPYDGPYQVISRATKTFIVRIRDRNVTISIDRLKPAYILADTVNEPDDNNNSTIVVNVPTQLTTNVQQPTVPPFQNETTPTAPRTTRSGRHVRFPDRYK